MDYSQPMWDLNMTMQQAVLAQQQPRTYNINLRNPRDEIPIEYNTGGGRPPPPPGAGAIARSYGPAKIPKERMNPFQGGGPPPAPGGATSPYPAGPRIKPLPPPLAPQIPATIARKRKGYQPEPMIATEPIIRKRKGSPPRGPGYRIGPSQPTPRQPNPSGFTPFTGRPQRLSPDNVDLREKAIQRMRELGHKGEQHRKGREMVDRMGDLGRAIRRGGAQGDVVGPGKRKNEEVFAPNPRRRTGDRPTGPQRFDIAT